MNREERLDDPEEALRIALENQQAQMWTALPGVVVSANLSAQTVSVQPTIQGSVVSPLGSAQLVNLPLLVDVPIVWPRAGGFALTFPVSTGDEVLLVFSSRCIDAWWQSGGVGAPVEPRMHDLSDAFAILAPTSQPKILPNVSSSSAQLRNETGATFVEVTTDGRVRIIAPNQIELAAPLVAVAGTFTVNGLPFNTHRHTGVEAGGAVSGGPTL